MDSVGLSSVQSLEAFSALLAPQEKHSGDQCENASVHLGPGNIGPWATEIEDVSSACSHKDSRDIWSEEEVAEGPQYKDHHDSRPQPEYEIVLKQAVGTEDLFLGLSTKDPSSMSCEAMLVKVHLADTEASELLLDVKEQFLDLRTAKYQLGLHLPRPVLTDGGRARFFRETQELQVTLPLKKGHGSISSADSQLIHTF